MDWNEQNDELRQEPEVVETPELVPAEPVSLPAPEPEPVTVEPEPEPVAVDPEPVAEVEDVEPEPELEPEPEPEEKASVLKKEISFRRKPKQPKEPKQPKAKQEKPAKEKGSGLKKEISLPSFGRRKKGLLDEDLALEPKKTSKTPRKRKERSSGGAKRSKRLVGLKIGGSQLAAARIVNTACPSSSRSRGSRSATASSWAGSSASPSCSPRS